MIKYIQVLLQIFTIYLVTGGLFSFFTGQYYNTFSILKSTRKQSIYELLYYMFCSVIYCISFKKALNDSYQVIWIFINLLSCSFGIWIILYKNPEYTFI